MAGRVRPTLDCWQNLQDKYYKYCHCRPVRSSSSCLIGEQLEGTRVTRKGDSNIEILAPTFTMVAAREQCPYIPTITPSKTCSAIFTDASKEGWGACINEHTARGTWSLPGSKLHIYYLELKAVFLAYKSSKTSAYTK